MQSHQMKRAAGNSAPTDPNFKQTVLLLHGDGTNGGQNNTFIDSSTNNFTITRNGNTTQGTFSPFSQSDGYWSNYFDGSGDELTLSTTTAAQIGSGDFSFECFVYATKSTNTFAQGLISYGIVGQTSGTSYASFQLSPTGYLNFFYAQTSSATLADPTLFPLNQWVHAVVCRSSSTISMFVNGSRVATASTSATVGSTGDRITIGGQWFANNTGRQLQSGYISNARIVKGSSAYDASQSSLSVPASNLTAITNTSLLTCQSNRFIDNSSNAFTITSNGDTAVTAFSPFAPTAAYVASTNGGSGYFDGTGDYLNVAASSSLALGSGDFTIECWFYCGKSADHYLFDMRTESEIYTYLDNTSLNYIAAKVGSSSQINAGTYNSNAWNHYAIVRSGSGTNNVSFFLNGTRTQQVTDTTNFSTNTPFFIGRRYTDFSGAFGYMNGYISNARVLKGTALYSGATYTVPTAPLTAITNTALLTNFTNAAIFDNTGKNDLETVGNAQISTSVVKYGTGSMYFDGTGDSLNIVSSSNLIFGSGNFTVEFWMYTSDAAADVISKRASGGYGAFGIYISGANTIQGYVSTTGTSWVFTGTRTFTNNVWAHIALVRDGSSIYLYLDGSQSTSGSVSTSALMSETNPVIIGGTRGNGDFVGYIDDLRITKGVARYTANFTVPARAFPDK